MKRLLIAAVVLLLGVLLFLFLRQHKTKDDRGLAVTIAATRLMIGPGGRVDLVAKVSPADQASGATYSWSTSGGAITGSGAQVTLAAPGMTTGKLTVAVTVTGKDRKSAHAQLDLEVVNYRDVDEANPRESRPSDHFSEGYVIRDVKLEKTEFCANEDIRVQIDAADPNGESAWLDAKVSMAGHSAGGLDTVARASVAFRDQPDLPQEVVVEVFDTRYPGVVAKRVIPVKIKACDTPGTGLFVDCSAGKRDDSIQCLANAGQGGGLPFEPVRYEWTVLTDDKGHYPLVTKVPRLLWQVPVLTDKATVNHVILARAFGPKGEMIEGRGATAISNVYYFDRAKLGVLVLRIRYSPPMRRGKDWVVSVQVANPHSETVTVEEVFPMAVGCEDGVKPVTLPLPTPMSLLKTTTLASGESVRFEWSAPDDPTRCNARVELRGHGTSGREIRAAFNMPTGAAGRIDPAQLGAVEQARWQLAQKILSERAGHQVDVVSAEDMDALEAEGLVPLRDPKWQPPPLPQPPAGSSPPPPGQDSKRPQ